MNVANHAVRTRQQARQIIPPIQFETTGETISIVDGAIAGVLFALVFAALSLLLGFDPREVA